MSEISESIERYKDWYCEDLIRAYFNKLITLDDLLQKLDYSQVSEQKDLFNYLNFLLTKKYPHKCYNELCNNKLFFSNTFEFAKKHLNLKLSEFVKIWTTSRNLLKFKVRSLEILFFCCECYEKELQL